MIKFKTCSNCGVEFQCGTTENDGSCWCSALPNIVPMPEVGDCLCPTCLKLRIREIETANGSDSQLLS